MSLRREVASSPSRDRALHPTGRGTRVYMTLCLHCGTAGHFKQPPYSRGHAGHTFGRRSLHSEQTASGRVVGRERDSNRSPKTWRSSSSLFFASAGGQICPCSAASERKEKTKETAYAFYAAFLQGPKQILRVLPFLLELKSVLSREIQLFAPPKQVKQAIKREKFAFSVTSFSNAIF